MLGWVIWAVGCDEPESRGLEVFNCGVKMEEESWSSSTEKVALSQGGGQRLKEQAHRLGISG